MITKKDLTIISHLRKDGRKKITDISKEMNIPVTTIYDKVRVHNQKFVNKHVALLDFAKLGLHTKANIAIKCDRDAREDLQKFLFNHPNVNSLSKTNFSSDFLAEVVFKSMGELQNFADSIEKNYRVGNLQIFNTIEELKKEDFLTKEEHFDLVE